MNNRVELVQELVSMARNWGLSEASASVYAFLALSGRALTMAELQRLTGYSLSSVSTNLRSLTDKYLVIKMKKEGVYVYKAEIDFEGIFRLLTRDLLERNIIPLYRKVCEAAPTDDLHHIVLLQEEMQKLIDYLSAIVKSKGESHAAKKDQIPMPSVS